MQTGGWFVEKPHAIHLDKAVARRSARLRDRVTHAGRFLRREEIDAALDPLVKNRPGKGTGVAGSGCRAAFDRNQWRGDFTVGQIVPQAAGADERGNSKRGRSREHLWIQGCGWFRSGCEIPEKSGALFRIEIILIGNAGGRGFPGFPHPGQTLRMSGFRQVRRGGHTAVRPGGLLQLAERQHHGKTGVGAGFRHRLTLAGGAQ